MSKDINSLINENINNLLNLKKTLSSDLDNVKYFSYLVKKYLNNLSEAKLLIKKNVFPFALLDEKTIKENVDLINYSDLKEEDLNIKLTIMRTNAGIGSSIKRNKYLLNNFQEKTIGSKSTDLFIDNEKNIFDCQILQAKLASKDDFYKEINFIDVVGSETKDKVRKTWKKNLNFLGDKFVRGEEVFQDKFPNIKKNKFTNERKTPLGHGFFAFNVLSNISNLKDVKNKLCVISNGEDLNAVPDKKILSYVFKEKIPVAIVTTDKTSRDLKGGQISLVKNKGNNFLTILEIAQAKRVGQEELFYKLGLRENDHKSYFNTNTAIFNLEVLKNLISKINDEKEFLEVICPDLILNEKNINGDEFTQIEGALGSCVLNFDKYFRLKFNKRILSIINIEEKNRFDFFTPIKNAFDFYINYFSGLFVLNKKTMKLCKSEKFISLPFIEAENDYYNDVENVLNSFKNTDIFNLKLLKIKGKVDLSGLKLKESIYIENNTLELVTLSKLGVFKEICNKKIVIDEGFNISVKSL
jgi:hypothetical protein